jgi:hypothetical protein
MTTKKSPDVAWDTFDREEVKKRLGPEQVRAAREHAAESLKLTKRLLRLRVPSGLVAIVHGPLLPVLKNDLSPMPASASPRCYQILWYGHEGSEYPPTVDNNVLLRGHRLQVWAVDDAADVVRIVKAAFNEDIRLPREEPKS